MFLNISYLISLLDSLNHVDEGLSIIEHQVDDPLVDVVLVSILHEVLNFFGTHLILGVLQVLMSLCEELVVKFLVRLQDCDGSIERALLLHFWL